MSATTSDEIEALTQAGTWIKVQIAAIGEVAADDDRRDVTLLTLRDGRIVVVPEDYEDVVDWIVASWRDR